MKRKTINLSKFNLIKKHHYSGLSNDANKSAWIYFGAPFDGTSTYRKGSRFAPDAIRKETFLCQETYSPYFESDLENVSIADVGNLNFKYEKTHLTLQEIKKFSKEMMYTNKKPFMIGGEHLVTLPVLESLYEKYPDLRVIHIDAHADMIDELFGEKVSHGTVMRRIHDFLGDKRIYHLGIRSGSKEELEFAKKHNFLRMFDLLNLKSFLSEWETYPIYLSIDLDGFDPSQIPGTGTPEAGGIFFREFISFLKSIQNLNFIGIDVCELSPNIDPTGMSTIFASKVIRETISACC